MNTLCDHLKAENSRLQRANGELDRLISGEQVKLNEARGNIKELGEII